MSFDRIRSWIAFAMVCILAALPSFLFGKGGKQVATNPPIYIAFLWHMHQPIYWPYESIVQTDANGRYSYSVTDIHNQRIGPYTVWPKNAVQAGINAGLAHLGAQVSFSGSLIENLNNLEAAGNGNFQNWKSSWNYIKNQKTSLNNPRLDMVGFGYFHPLMGLIDYVDIKRQIEAHKATFAINFPGTYSKGIFPPENAFSPREIPALVDEGLQWVLVDNVHFDRACLGYPFSTSGNLYEPNKADIRNANPNDWVQLTDLWAPTRNSAKWGRQPHYVQYTDPNDGSVKKIIAVPADRYMGNEDGRGGFGALQYDAVMSQLQSYNTDPNHPILVVLHHDGDNYGGGSESYYNSNFQSFVSWLQANPSRFVCTTIQDYLDMFPPDPNDVIHVEDGSWSGADNGDPEFLKWNGDPVNGYSPDRNSWGVVTAAKNLVLTANQISPNAANTQNAWKYMLCAEASDYWYWDGSEGGIWDSHPTRACNQAVQYAQQVISSGGTDLTPPTIYIPQREPYNPGGTEWGIAQASDFKVWTYAYDVSGLASVTLRYRTDKDGAISSDNETYAGGSGVNDWVNVAMSGTAITPQTNPLPALKANEYSAMITGQNNVMIDYYVEAVDGQGNIGRSPIRHVWVGASTSGGGGGGTATVNWAAQNPTVNDPITITVTKATQGAKLHWGINYSGSTWLQPNSAYWPPNTVLFGGTGPAVETPMTGPDTSGNLTLTIGPFNNAVQSVQSVAFVIHYNDGSWNNNSSQDYHITVSGSTPTPQPYTFVMDGTLDTAGHSIASNSNLNLYVGWNGTLLYIATQPAQSQGSDMFIFIADTQMAPITAPWAKSGTVAAWKVFLANESSNNWSGWYNSAGTGVSGSAYASTAGSSLLEGTVNLQTVFGYLPSKLYLAVGKYQTDNGGSLSAQAPAGNGDGALTSDEFVRYQFTTYVPPLPPATVSLAGPASGVTGQPLSVLFQWHPDSGAAYYHLQVSPDSMFGGLYALNDSSITDTSRTVFGLAQHAKFFWRVQAKNAGGVSAWSEVRSFTTLLQLPFTVTLVSPAPAAVFSTDTILFRWRQTTKEVTAYELRVSADSAGNTLTTDSTVADTSLTLNGFSSDVAYWWNVRAQNASGWGNYTAARSMTIHHQTGVTVGLTVRAGWNMVSNPIQLANDSLPYVFPISGVLSKAYLYDPGGGYLERASMPAGIGFWLKLQTPQSFSLTGSDVVADSIPVAAGWNMIGSISYPVDTSAVQYSDGMRKMSAFYGYQNAYVPATAIEPGKSYWIKVDAPGYVIMHRTTVR